MVCEERATAVLQMALWSLLVEALSATLGLPRTLSYWPLTIGIGSMDEEPEPQTMFLKVLGSLSDPEGSAGFGTSLCLQPSVK